MFLDLKKLMKYEQKSKATSEIIPQKKQVPENVINVTIINGASAKEIEQPPTKISKSVNVQAQTDTDKEEIPEEKKQSKKFLRLPKHIKTNNPRVINKRGSTRKGVLVRNTPTDLYKKYQEDWIKFKTFIPGENERFKVRRSVRRKMQQKDSDDTAKVRKYSTFVKSFVSFWFQVANHINFQCFQVYVHFPDATGDH